MCSLFPEGLEVGEEMRGQARPAGPREIEYLLPLFKIILADTFEKANINHARETASLQTFNVKHAWNSHWALKEMWFVFLRESLEVRLSGSLHKKFVKMRKMGSPLGLPSLG